MKNEALVRVYGLVVKLNEIVNKCVLGAELYAHREIKWK